MIGSKDPFIFILPSIVTQTSDEMYLNGLYLTVKHLSNAFLYFKRLSSYITFQVSLFRFLLSVTRTYSTFFYLFSISWTTS